MLLKYNPSWKKREEKARSTHPIMNIVNIVRRTNNETLATSSFGTLTAYDKKIIKCMHSKLWDRRDYVRAREKCHENQLIQTSYTCAIIYVWPWACGCVWVFPCKKCMEVIQLFLFVHTLTQSLIYCLSLCLSPPPLSV